MILGLRLEHFRSYTHLELEVPTTPLIYLIGPNGAGKTNLLEALSLLGGGRGLRGAQAQTLKRRDHSGDPAWVVEAQVLASPLRHRITLAFGGAGQIRRLNGKATAGTRLAALVPTVALTPLDDTLFRGPAEGRRALLDRYVISLFPDHRRQLSAYQRAVRERNAILRLAAKEAQVPDAAWLTGLEALMASHGVALAHQRRIHLGQLATAVAQGLGPFPAARLALDGTMEADLAIKSAPEVEAAWIRQWAQDRPKDLAAGRTLQGPHGTDLAVTFAATGMPAAQCSTGEQKALLLSLFLGQARLLKAADIRPLLLLDEVAAHLDVERRAALMRELVRLETQTWITGTDQDTLMPPELADKSTQFHLPQAFLS